MPHGQEHDISEDEITQIAEQVAEDLAGEPMTDEEIAAEITRMNRGE